MKGLQLTIASEEPSTDHLVMSPLLILRRQGDMAKTLVFPPLSHGKVETPAAETPAAETKAPPKASIRDDDVKGVLKRKCFLFLLLG